MKVLVTGINGFVGPHVLRELQNNGHEVWGVSRNNNEVNLPCEVSYFDLIEEDQTKELLDRVQPEVIIHLAAQSNPAKSWDLPVETFDANVGMTITLLKAASSLPKPVKFLHISSSDVYGRPTKDEVPVRETNELRPDNPYAVSKVAAEHCAHLYGNRYGIQVVAIRPFSHTGPGQSDNFVVPAFARQVAAIEALQISELSHGDLMSYRDFTDVRDVARAYRLIMESDTLPQSINVCSGRCVQIKWILDQLISMSHCDINTLEDSKRKRAEKRTPIKGSFTKLHTLTGWEPEIEFEQTLHDVLEDQRSQIQNQTNSFEKTT